jgi:hypothetical protein
VKPAPPWNLTGLLTMLSFKLKIRNVSKKGNQTFIVLWHFAEKLFYLKKGFIKDL